MAGFLEVFFKS